MKARLKTAQDLADAQQWITGKGEENNPQEIALRECCMRTEREQRYGRRSTYTISIIVKEYIYIYISHIYVYIQYMFSGASHMPQEKHRNI